MSKELFTRYYRNNTWEGSESVSGPGSDYEQTKYLVPELQIMLDIFNIKSIVDAPCGDFNWMRNVDLSKVNYLGGDIVDQLVAANTKKYAKDNISFQSINIVTDIIPKADLVIVRDCLVHLPTQDIFKALRNIKNSGSKYLLTTNFTWKAEPTNYDIPVGHWRRINLEQEPFFFPFPKYVIIEGHILSHDRDKTMSLWEIKDIPDYKE